MEFDREFARAYKYPIFDIYTGVATISDASSLHSMFFRPDGKESRFIKTRKISLASYYSIKNSSKILLVVNTHALNWVSVDRFIQQLEALEALVSSHEGPLIWAGDFNIWAGEKHQYFKSLLQRNSLTQVSFPEDRRTRYEDGMAVDFILLRGIEVVNSRTRDNIKGSDHVPLEASLLIRSKNN